MSGVETSAILDAAQRLLHEAGVDFTMEQLEDRVGVSRATLYRRIGSKATLLERLAADRGEVVGDAHQEILHAARAVIGREGLTGATMDQIADEAGVGVATVYRHFETKDGLLRSFIEEMTPRPVVKSLSRHPGADVAAELKAIVTELVTFVHENRDILRITFLGDEPERRYVERLREQSDSTIGWLTRYFARQQAEGRLTSSVAPHDLALGLMGIVLAFAMIGPLHYGVALSDPEAAAKTISDMFLNDLKE